MAFTKTFIVSDESVNDRGFWVRTSGIDLSNAERNCPAYFMHQTWEIPLGHWENFRVNEQAQLLADLVIEGGNDIEKEYIRKIENSDIKGASIGADVVEWNDEEMFLKDGQTRPCLFKSSLFEISLAPLNGNKNALALKQGGNMINLSAEGSETHLPVLKLKYNMKTISLKLGLAESASENDILNAIGTLQLNAGKAENLQTQLNSVHADGLSDDDKEIFVTLAKTDFDKAVKFAAKAKLVVLENTAEEIKPDEKTVVTKETTIVNLIQQGKNKNGSIAEAEGDKTCFDYLQKHNPVELKRIHAEDNAKYIQLAKEYSDGKRYTGK